MSEEERHVHFCECSECMNMGGGVPAQATPVRRTNLAPVPRWREAPRGTASAEAKLGWKRQRDLRRQLGNGTGQP